jgi:hypothetical protein
MIDAAFIERLKTEMTKRKPRAKRSLASKAFGVSDETLEQIRRMDGATWTEDEYRKNAGDPFRGWTEVETSTEEN